MPLWVENTVGEIFILFYVLLMLWSSDNNCIYDNNCAVIIIIEFMITIVVITRIIIILLRRIDEMPLWVENTVEEILCVNYFVFKEVYELVELCSNNNNCIYDMCLW